MNGYYPPASFYFCVSFGSGGSTDIDAAFTEVSGLNSERTVQEVMEGGENQFVHRLPGRSKSTNLVLKRGLMALESDVFQWCKSTMESGLDEAIDTRVVTVQLLGEEEEVLMAWVVSGAWPVKWSVERFDATASKVAFETLELAYAGLTRSIETPLTTTGQFKTRAEHRNSGA